MFVYKAIKEIIIACICVTMNRQSEAHNRDSKCLPSWYIFVNDAFKMSLSAKTLRCGYMTLLNQKSGLYQNATLCVDSVNKTGQSGCYTITYITCNLKVSFYWLHAQQQKPTVKLSQNHYLYATYLFGGRYVDLNNNPFHFPFILLNEAAHENRKH